MAEPTELSDLVAYLARTTRLTASEPLHVINEVLCATPARSQSVPLARQNSIMRSGARRSEPMEKSCLPLAAADLFAYTAWGAEVGQKPIGTARNPTKSEASYRGNYFKIMVNRDTLDSLHEQAIVFAHEEASAGRLAGRRSGRTER